MPCFHCETLVAQSSKIAERLLAHARLCRQIAEQSWSEDAAARLERLADECTSAAANLAVEPAQKRH
jgi:histone H3/H4